MLDSSRNLRVLWVRALLASTGAIQDDVAYQLLPSASRWLVSPFLAPLWSPILPSLDWITKRTQFVDQALTEFLDVLAEGERGQVVLLGAG